MGSPIGGAPPTRVSVMHGHIHVRLGDDFRSPVLIGVLAALALLTGSACRGAQSGPAGQQGFPPAAVALAVAHPADIEDATEFVAALKSLRSTAIQPQIDGQITRIFVKSGDRIAAGTPLLQIDPRRQQAAVSSQEAERAAKEASVTYARSREQRAKELFSAGAISKEELEQAETALRTVEAELRSTEAQVQERQVQLRYFSVLAPTTGIVGDVPVRVGNQVTPDTLLTTIEENETLEVYVSVPLERAGDLKEGLPVQLLTADGTALASTTISFISSRVDDQTQSVLVKGLVENRNRALRSSQFVRARIVWRSEKGLLIPVVAVTRVNGQYFGYVAEDTSGGLVARQRPLKLGHIVGDDYAVLSGLQPGDRVIVSGIQKLADGAPVAAQK